MAATPARQSTITVGDIRITYLPDGEGHIATGVLPDATADDWQVHAQWLDDGGRILTTFGGFLTSGGNLTFPNARHITGEAEWAHWQQPDESGLGPDPEAVVGPLAGRIEHTGAGEAIAPGVNIMETPGHTPGHNSLVVSSGSERTIILGDVIWCPVQIQNEEWKLAFDVDPDLARRTREAMLRELEGSQAIACGSHFSEAVYGRVLTGEGKRQWQTTT